MTMMGSSPAGSGRAFGFFMASVIHVAAGWALFSNSPAGTPTRGNLDRGRDQLLVVELLPLDHVGVAQQQAAGEAVRTKTPDELQLAMISGRGTLQATTDDRAIGSTEGQGSGSPLTPLSASASSSLPTAELLAYRARLQEHLDRYRIYPPGARNAGQQGVVQVHFVMDRAGRVIDLWIESSSGFEEIDREALGSIKRAQPLPALPGMLPDKLDISLPITFKIG